MNSKLLFASAVISVCSARSKWQFLELSLPEGDKNKFSMYWYTVDDAVLGPIIRPTLKLVFDDSQGIKDTDRVAMCLAYRHTAGFKDPLGSDIPVSETWEAMTFYTDTNWGAQDWTTLYNN